MVPCAEHRRPWTISCGPRLVSDHREARWRPERAPAFVHVLLPKCSRTAKTRELDRAVKWDGTQQPPARHRVDDDESVAVGAMPKHDISPFRHPNVLQPTNSL